MTYSIKQIQDTLYNSNILSTVIKLSDYNKLAKAFGFEKESLKDENDSLVIPSKKLLIQNLIKIAFNCCIEI